ncbi:hypothetical protein MACK_003417 [Theileria orientalis]|uniref:Uncharacterized protein n=1 Tax=Theileria orientalis TaxID=68886 RepID=A0A976SIP7_THEOR|nr:hypothetical protein MACK_003417 [Theileria orientalis]
MVEDAICLIVFFVFGIIALLMNIVVPKSRAYFITHPNKAQ